MGGVEVENEEGIGREREEVEGFPYVQHFFVCGLHMYTLVCASDGVDGFCYFKQLISDPRVQRTSWPQSNGM